MRLLFLLQGRELEDQIGAVDALRKLQAEGVLSVFEAIPYWQYGTDHGWPAFWRHVEATARQMDADTIFFQFFHGAMGVERSQIEALRQLPSKPTLVVSSGDPFGQWFNRLPRSLRLVSSMADLTFMTGMGYMADSLARTGSRNLLFMTNGHCQVRFSAPESAPPAGPDFDVVFIGSRHKARNFLSDHFRAAYHREQIVRALQQRYGDKFGLFGHHWEGFSSWQGATTYAEQGRVYRRARIAIGGFPHSLADYYTSDRVFIAAVSGTPFVDQFVPRVDRILRDGEHWWLYRNQAEMLQLCDKLLALSDAERWTMGQRTAQYCAARHSQYHRNREMLMLARSYREAGQAGLAPARPQLEYFLPEVDQVAEWPYATRNWTGR